MKMNANKENQIKNRTLALLKNGRPDFDVPHTLAVVYWMKELLKNEAGDEKILIPAAYLHDIGYSRMKIAAGWQGTKDAKKDHMAHGAALAKPILKDLGFDLGEREKIIKLIRAHDKLETISSPEECLLFEADSLGQIDIARVRSNFDLPDRKKFIDSFEKNRLPRFKTKTGKKLASILFPRAKSFYLEKD